MKFLQKQIQKGMMSFHGESNSFFVDFISKQVNIFGYFSVTIMLIMSSILELQYYLHGKNRKLG